MAMKKKYDLEDIDLGISYMKCIDLLEDYDHMQKKTMQHKPKDILK